MMFIPNETASFSRLLMDRKPTKKLPLLKA
jgi:hypothetical protein